MQFLRPTSDLRKRLLDTLTDTPSPSSDATLPAEMLSRCPAHGVTPLREVPGLAADLGVHSLHLKDERDRMGLGSFKALGAAYVIAHDAARGQARGRTYVTASAGNHGLSVAAGAAAFGARSVVYLAETVPESFAARLRAQGAEVRREGAVYEHSMAAAAKAASDEGFALLSDSSWPGYMERPHRLMEGYLVLMQETVEQMPAIPTHIFLQAGVGGLAAACARFARRAWGNEPEIIVVEPEVAPALFASVKAGRAVLTTGPDSAMGRLDCKEPSLIALKGLTEDADAFMTLTEAQGQAGCEATAAHGLPSTPSGSAGVAGALAATKLLAAHRGQARVLAILSEGPTA